jgi:hypothetical protein
MLGGHIGIRSCICELARLSLLLSSANLMQRLKAWSLPQEAVQILRYQQDRFGPRPARLLDANATIFIEDPSRSRRVLGAGDDRWTLAGTAAVPKQAPQVAQLSLPARIFTNRCRVE